MPIVFSPVFLNKTPLISPLSEAKIQKNKEVFGFAPYWNLGKLDTIDFSVLTTLAYFDVPVDGYGNMETEGYGYQTFMGERATNLFKKAHANGTRVVLTLTQMNNPDIESLMDNQEGQDVLIEDVTSLVKKRGIDGVNVDFEYIGDPGQGYRNEFSEFVSKLTQKMHKEIPNSRVTVSVYASAVKDPKIYDIKTVAQASDGIFMMAYDFATASADQVMPTDPLNGYKEGKYWYDISTAVEDFLKVMPANKLILGLPWYGYDYPVNKPGIKEDTLPGYYSYYWWGGYRYSYYVAPPPAKTQTYAKAQDDIVPVKSGWDDYGKVGWKAYIENGVWRMIFVDDVRSLKLKYNFAKDKNLAGVGIWALGYEDGKKEMWSLLADEFGIKLVDNRIVNQRIDSSI